MRILKGILLPALLLAVGPAFAKEKKGPGLASTGFDSLPGGLFYFDDSEVVIATTSAKGTVWRSDNAGKEWKMVKDIPEGKVLEVVKSPFDNTVAVALGGETTHWITYDQGESWTDFETQGAISAGVAPVSFHAKDSKKLLFHGGAECGDFRICLGKVSTGFALACSSTDFGRPGIRKMASSPSPSSSAATGRCVSGPRVRTVFSRPMAANTMTAFFALSGANTQAW
jgi:hypothetical protein